MIVLVAGITLIVGIFIGFALGVYGHHLAMKNIPQGRGPEGKIRL